MLLGCAIVAGVGLRSRAETERRYVEMVACLVGRERVTDVAEAEVRARRLHPLRTREDFESCARAARSLRGSWAAWVFHTGLARSARTASRAFDDHAMPNLADLISRALHVPWSVPENAPAAPTPLLDRNIPTLRVAVPTQLGYQTSDIESEQLSLRTETRRLVLSGSSRGAWSLARWADPAPRRYHAFSSDGEVHATDGRHRWSVGLGDEAAFVDSTLLVRRGTDVVAFRLVEPDAEPSGTARVPVGTTLSDLRACALGDTYVLAIEGLTEIAVLAMHGGSLAAWGVLAKPNPEPPEYAGAVMLTCDHDVARIAYAVSHPETRDAPDLVGDRPYVPSLARHHSVVSARCDVEGCRQREVAVRGIEAGWSPIRRGDTSPPGGDPTIWNAPRVVAFGEHVLVLWIEHWAAIRYRVETLENLDRAEGRWLAETYLAGGSTSPDPRRVAFPTIGLHARDDVALVQVSEVSPVEATYLVRFQGDDAAPEVLVPERP